MPDKKLPEETGSVRGLMDAQMVSEYLGMSRGTLRSWEKRRIEGKPGGPPKDFPSPIGDRLGGASLWEESEVVAYRRRREAAEGNKNLDPGKPAADTEATA